MASLDPLYAARYHILRGEPVPDGAPRRAVLELLAAKLGPPPAALVQATSPTAETAAAPPAPLVDDPPQAFLPRWRHVDPRDFPIIGVAMGDGRLPAYLKGVADQLNLPSVKWRPTQICIHHTAAPSLKQRPQGFLPEHMDNLRDYYRAQKWRSGPHWFVDDHAAWAFSPMTSRGVHAKAFNATAIGIEMLGDYDTEDPETRRGGEVLARTADLVARLMRLYGIDEDGIVFHRDDPETDKTCPGKRVSKLYFKALVRSYLSRL